MQLFSECNLNDVQKKINLFYFVDFAELFSKTFELVKLILAK